MSEAFKPQRVFTDVFDYNARRKTDVTLTHATSQAMLARLRLDAIVFDKIVFADVQLLHSLFLSGAAALDDEREIFARQIPFKSLEIRTRERSLSNTIVSLVRPPGSNLQFLTPHLFTFIDPTNEARSELVTIRSSEVKSWRDVPRVLRMILGNSERIDLSERAWAFWVQAERDGRLTTVPWEKSSFDFSGELKKKMVDGIAKASEGMSEFGLDIVQSVMKGGVSRGDLAALLNKEDENQTLSFEEYDDLQRIEFEFSSAYNRVSAIQHRCNRTDTNVFGFQGLIERDALTPEGLANMIAVPVEIIVGLGEMPDEAFAQYTDRMKKRLERWRNRGERGELEIVFGRLLDAIRESGVHAGAQDKMIGPASWVIPYLRTIKGPISDLATLVVPTGFPTETLSDAASYAIDKLDGVARDRVIKSFVDYADRRLDETGG